METLSSIESFVRSAEMHSFSAAARIVGLTPGGVSKNVAKLEADLGVRLFQRSTRQLTLTEAGEQLLAQVAGGLDTIQVALANAKQANGQPSGTLKVSMAMAFGRDHLLPLLPKFLERYPAIKPDWRFDNRQVDLIGEAFDAAIGGGLAISPGVVVRELAKIHFIVVASPTYFKDKPLPIIPSDLSGLDAILRFSQTMHRVAPWHLRTQTGEQVSLELPGCITLSDPDALCCAARMGLGITHVPLLHAMPYLKRGELIRVLPNWYSEGGAISLYFAAKKLMPAKTRVFVDFIVDHFRQQGLSERWSAF